MYLLKKVAKNLLKNKARNSIILILLIIVITASSVSLSIFNITKLINSKTKNYYSGEVTLVPHDDSINIKEISSEDFKKYVDSDYLRSYVFYKSTPIKIQNLKLFDEKYNRIPDSNSRKGMFIPNTGLYGMLDGKSMEDFSYGERTIIEGSFPSNEKGCMISKNLAILNNLKLGDYLTFQTINEVSIESAEGPQITELVITGIYKDDTVERHQANHRGSMLNARNDIITNMEFFKENKSGFESVSSFLLKKSKDIKLFQKELYSKGLSKNFTVQYDLNRYTEAKAEINKMSKIVTAFLSIIACIGVVIVYFVNLFALRERKYEIGVLRSIGMSKSKVVFLLVGEMMVLAFVGIIVALIAGALINPEVVNFMMRLEMNYELPSALKSAVSGINSSFSIKVTLELFASTILLVLLAGSMTISRIVRFDPTEILAERN